MFKLLNSKRNLCHFVRQNKNSVFVLITFPREISAPQSLPAGDLLPQGCSAALQKQALDFPRDPTATAPSTYAHTENLYSQKCLFREAIFKWNINIKIPKVIHGRVRSVAREWSTCLVCVRSWVKSQHHQEEKQQQTSKAGCVMSLALTVNWPYPRLRDILVSFNS